MARTVADILNEYRERKKRDGTDAALDWLCDQGDEYEYQGEGVLGNTAERRYDTTWRGTAYGGFYVERY